MRNLFVGLLIVAAIVIGGGFVANEAYQAGLHTAVTTAAANAPAGSVVTPVVPGAYGYPYGYGYGFGGWGYGHGFSIFGFLGTLLFIFIIVGLLRAIFWRNRWGGGWGRGWGGYGHGYGKWGPGGPGRWGDPSQTGEHDPRNRFHQTFEDWHREAHGSGTTGEPGSTGAGSSTGSTSGTTGSTGSTGSTSS
jgi:hypothetical protein